MVGSYTDTLLSFQQVPSGITSESISKVKYLACNRPPCENFIKQLIMFFQSYISFGGHLSGHFQVVRLIFSLQNQSWRTLIASFHYPAIKKVLYCRAYIFQVANPINCCQEGKKGQKVLVRKVTGWKFTSHVQQQQQRQQQQ